MAGTLEWIDYLGVLIIIPNSVVSANDAIYGCSVCIY